MGRKAGGLYINPKKFGNLQKPCMKEMITFLNCLALSQGNDQKCTRQKSQLSACMDAQTANKRKPWGTINYHLQRLNKGRVLADVVVGSTLIVLFMAFALPMLYVEESNLKDRMQ